MFLSFLNNSLGNANIPPVAGLHKIGVDCFQIFKHCFCQFVFASNVIKEIRVIHLIELTDFQVCDCF